MPQPLNLQMFSMKTAMSKGILWTSQMYVCMDVALQFSYDIIRRNNLFGLFMNMKFLKKKIMNFNIHIMTLHLMKYYFKK